MTHIVRLPLIAVASVSLAALTACYSAGQTPGTHARYAAGQSRADCARDFALAVTPASASIPAGSSKTFQIGLTSVCGLAGSINVGTTHISPAGNGHGPTPHQARYDLPLDAGGKAGVPVTFSTTVTTVKTTYAITITAKDVTGGCCYGLTHTEVVSLTVQ